MVHKNTDDGTSQSRQNREPCRGADISFVFLFQLYAQEQSQWNNKTSELTISCLPMCGNSNPSIRWRLSGAIFKEKTRQTRHFRGGNF